MTALNKFNNFVDTLCKGGVNLGSDTIKIMLTNTAPVATNSKYSDISGTELANGNGYTTGGATAAATLANATGTENMTLASTTFTSNTGAMGPFRYVVIYDASATNAPLLGWYDYGSSISLNGAAGETFVVNPGTPFLALT